MFYDKANMRPLIGGHVSASGGAWKAFENAERIDAEAIQMFGASPQSWSFVMPSAETIQKFRDAWQKSRVKQVYLHAAYLVNLASPDAEMRKKSIVNLAGHLAIASALRTDGLIFHVGSGKNSITKEEALNAAATGISEVLNNVPGETKLIIENAAGGGDKVGSDPETIGALMRLVNSQRIRVCIDTAHAFEAGLIERYEPNELNSFLDGWNKEVGLENIVALHMNDSKTAFNSRHDRHENIGEGHIGLSGFKNLAKEERLHHAAWILEVPGFEGTGPDQKNIEILKSCFAS